MGFEKKTKEMRGRELRYQAIRSQKGKGQRNYHQDGLLNCDHEGSSKCVDWGEKEKVEQKDSSSLLGVQCLGHS